MLLKRPPTKNSRVVGSNRLRETSDASEGAGAAGCCAVGCAAGCAACAGVAAAGGAVCAYRMRGAATPSRTIVVMANRRIQELRGYRMKNWPDGWLDPWTWE